MMNTSDLPQTLLVSFLILGTSVFIGMIYSRTNSIKETFVDTTAPSSQSDILMSDITLQSCPAGTTGYTKDGITNCCNGDIVSNTCNGNTVCALSTSTDYPSCQTLLRKSLQDKALQFCPKSLPRYYEDTENPSRKRNELPKKGCSASMRTSDGKNTIDPNAKKCYIYPTSAENYENANSCYNVRVAENYKCPGTGKPAQIVNLGNGNILHSCSYVGTKKTITTITQRIQQLVPGSKTRTVPKTITQRKETISTIPVSCYSELSYYNMILKAKNSIPNLQKDELLNFCSVSKNYYLDKSINDESFVIPNELTKIRNNLTNLIKSEEKKYI